MKIQHLVRSILLGICFALGVGNALAEPRVEQTPLTPVGEKLQARYEAMLTALRTEIVKSLPKLDEEKFKVLQKARDAVKAAEANLSAVQKSLDKIQEAKALVEHAKSKWIAEAERGIAQAEAALKKATTEAEREAARKELEKWQRNREEGLKALKERQEALDKLKADEPKLLKAYQEAQEALAQARNDELLAAKAILSEIEPFLASDELDEKLVKAAVLAHATPRELAEFAQQGEEKEELVGKLLSDTALMKQMLEAGGAKFGKYGKAMEIYTEVQKASPRAREGMFQRLALAIALEHAVPIEQRNAEIETDAPTFVDPVKRYLHYEKAYLDGELDPAFKGFSVWEYRMVVNSEAPDHILAWARQMLRNYRPDFVYNPDYNWRYVMIVRTDVRYGSQDVKYDFPILNFFQNIPKDGGVCGRRAFFGRFILKSFGIPTWGVTQPAHAALSHWTPSGWVINLGAGWEKSWWDKDEAPRSGTDFLLETQARKHPQDYLKVLRAQWISRVLGEEAYNDRKGVEGGIWSKLAHYLMVILASKAVESGKAVELGPAGQEFAEANEPKGKLEAGKIKMPETEEKPFINSYGTIAIPAASFSKASGPCIVMKSFLGGKQIHCTGGFNAEYVVEVPQARKYAFYARVVTLQEGQEFLISVNDAKTAVEVPVPYTVGMWQLTQPVQLSLIEGKNVIRLTLGEGSRGVSIKDFMLVPID
jgi:predicted  nucleic acid-binding Zn-ribbon protein